MWALLWPAQSACLRRRSGRRPEAGTVTGAVVSWCEACRAAAHAARGHHRGPLQWEALDQGSEVPVEPLRALASLPRSPGPLMTMGVAAASTSLPDGAASANSAALTTEAQGPGSISALGNQRRIRRAGPTWIRLPPRLRGCRRKPLELETFTTSPVQLLTVPRRTNLLPRRRTAERALT